MLQKPIMELKEILKENNFSSESIEAITSSGITELYPPQVEAVQKGLLKSKNILMSVPTAAGKTLMAELCMLKSILQDNGRCLYIAPLKALASEKYEDFKRKYDSLGINIGISVGDYDYLDKNLQNYQILIATAEKVDSLLRSKATWLINSLTVVVLDEIHFINDNGRGPVLEILTARIKQLNPKIQILALSATVKNALQVAGWLEAECVQSNWRPIPLKEGVYYNQRIQFNNYPNKIISEEAPDDLNQLALDTLRGRGQILIFVNSRRSAQAVAREVCSSSAKILTPDEKKELMAIAKEIVGSKSDATKICQKLSDCIIHGVAFHHAGLKPHQRELVERNFKKNLIKIISCTPTLAAGVNLPARRAIIRDVKRFEAGTGAAYIPVSEYKQCAGRAGRPQYDDYGEAVIMAKTLSEAETLMDKFILADTEPIYSKLASESALRMHILASIAGGYVQDIKGMLEFFSHTFLHYQKMTGNLSELIEGIFEFLHRENFIDKSESRFFATPLGNLTSRLYIDPFSAIIIRNGLKLIADKQIISLPGVIHLISCCPDTPLIMNSNKKAAEEAQKFISENERNFILTPKNCEILDDYFFYLSTIKTTWLITTWVEEEKEDFLCELFNIGPGDIYRHVESFERLLFAAERIAHLMHFRSLTFGLDNIKRRVRYGIKEELLELVSLRNVGRVRARILFDNGYKKLSDLKNLSEDKLSGINSIGKTLARSIIAQLNKEK